MDGFSRAYRDPKSPLTPILPLSVNNVFSFCLGGDDSLKAWIDHVDAGRQKRSPNTCGLQSRSSPRYGALTGRHSPYASGVRGASSSTKSPNCISNSAASLVANCILSRSSYNSPRSSATAESSCAASTSGSKSPRSSSAHGSTVASTSSRSSTASGSTRCGSTSSHYESARGSTSPRCGSTSSHYESARGSTSPRCSSTSLSYKSACSSASSQCGSTSAASTARCSSQSSSSSSSSDLTCSNASCSPRADRPKIVVNGQQSQAENAGVASLLEWVVDRLSPSPRKNQPNMTDCLLALLSRFGLEKYFPIFQREEIDIEVFRSLTLTDLILLGITNANDCALLMDAVAAAFLLRYRS